MNEQEEFPDAYPCTIVRDRYRGTYSGGMWLAFLSYIEDVPEDITSDDSTVRNFWDAFDEKSVRVGRGESPNEAPIDLHKKLNK